MTKCNPNYYATDGVQQCNNCHYSYRPEMVPLPELSSVICQRFPPTRLSEHRVISPIVQSDWWCGEWKGNI